MGVYLFVLIGGEPFCWPHLFDLLARHPATTFGIYTNGQLVTRAVADRLAALGNGQLAFSIEGFEQETDQRRGPGVFRRVLDAMGHCRAAGVHFAYSVTVTRANNDLVVSDNFVDFFITRGCTDGWYYQYMPVGCAPDAGLLPTAAQREHRRRRFEELRRTRDINLYDFMNDGPLVGGCICAGRIYLHINADGAVEPCVFYPFAVDTIHDTTLLAALQSPFFKAIRQHQAATDNWLVPCPVVDHPALLREAVAACHARPTQPTAPLLLDGLAAPLETHAAAYREIADAAWSREFSSPAYARRTDPPSS
jgi:MoaA/NifB/PqqE/SkfB family radical SAM enzyme